MHGYALAELNTDWNHAEETHDKASETGTPGWLHGRGSGLHPALVARARGPDDAARGGWRAPHEPLASQQIRAQSAAGTARP